jgi:hypothetical protein
MARSESSSGAIAAGSIIAALITAHMSQSSSSCPIRHLQPIGAFFKPML